MLEPEADSWGWDRKAMMSHMKAIHAHMQVIARVREMWCKLEELL